MSLPAKLPHNGASDPLKEFADTISVNLIGSYALSQAAVPHMPAGNSSIIHMSSTRAHQSEPDTAGYSASKAGLYGLTHSQVGFSFHYIVHDSFHIIGLIFISLRCPLIYLYLQVLILLRNFFLSTSLFLRRSSSSLISHVEGLLCICAGRPLP